jgi:hypothetical protein
MSKARNATTSAPDNQIAAKSRRTAGPFRGSANQRASRTKAGQSSTAPPPDAHQTHESVQKAKVHAREHPEHASVRVRGHIAEGL